MCSSCDIEEVFIITVQSEYNKKIFVIERGKVTNSEYNLFSQRAEKMAIKNILPLGRIFLLVDPIGFTRAELEHKLLIR